MELFSSNSNINFMRVRAISLTIAFLLMAVGIFFMATKSFNYALDFTGGTSTEIKFEKDVDVEQLRQRLEKNGFPGAEVRTFGQGNEIVIRMRLAKGDTVKSKQQTGVDILKAAQSPDNLGKVVSSDFVGPQIGNELAWNGLKAAMFVVLGFLGYVWVRFEWRFALAAIITTLHDVVLVAGWFSMIGHELDLAVLAGILSVMGYSINDTIVVFDRVRENFRNLQKLSPAEVLNRSVNQTLSRTIITSFVALLTVLALYFYGGNSLKGMAESQIIGIIFGTLSSIFVACPLLLWLGVTKQDLMPKMQDLEALERRP